MRILFVSGELTGSALCQKLISEGNEVKLYILRHSWKNCYSGIASKVEDWKKELSWVGKDGLIVFDDVAFGREQDALRNEGYIVVGSSENADLLEINRTHFQNILEQSGVRSLTSYEFNDPDDAIQFVIRNPHEWVVKQTTHVSVLNYVGSSPTGDDVIRVLKRYKARGITPIHLQKRIRGIEVGIARYFNGIDWVGPIEVNHEHKHLNENDVGPLTPEMGTILWYTDTEVRLFTETLAKLKPHLTKIGFKGDFDINFIVNNEGAWPLEATPRFGCPSTEIQIELHMSPWTEFLYAIGTGNRYPLIYKKGFGIAVSLVTPPFPYEPQGNGSEQIPEEQKKLRFTNNFFEQESNHIHFEEISKIDDAYVWSGKHGILLHVTAHGETIEEAQKLVYARIQNISFPVVYYRKDIGMRVMHNDIPQLKAWGWI